MTGKHARIAIVFTFLLLIAAFFVFDLGRYLTLDYLKSQKAAFDAYYAEHTGQTLLLYFTLYILATALSLPGAAVMTLAGGALFGFWTALLVVSFASSIGATLAFVVSRFLLRDWVQARFGDKLGAINTGIEREGALYLFSLRLVPLFPFFVINLVMGLTPMKVRTFYWVSQVGMLAGTAVYVNAGTQLGRLESAAGILSPGIIISFVILGIFPLVAKKILEIVKTRKAMKKFPRPEGFDYNLVVLGAGSAGLVTAYIAAAVKAKVALIERHKMGGDCLNTGCVPSKALIRTAKMLGYARRAKEFGLKKMEVEFDFAEVMERVQRIIAEIEPHDSAERYRELGVDCILGEARVTSPWTVEVDGRTLTTRAIVVATGATPFVPPIKGIEQVDYLTSDTIWELRELPQKLVVLGGGPIGCEMTQAFTRLGAKVTLVEKGPQIMGREDADAADFIRQRFEAEGARVLTGHRAREVLVEDGRQILLCEHRGEEVQIEFDRLLVALGRRPNVTGFGLEELGVRLNDRRSLETDPFLRTNIPTIFCAGDVTGPYQFTHTAGHQAWYAAVNALFGDFKKFKVDYRVIPWCTFTDPEVARVGLNETEARELGLAFEVTRYGLDDLDRAIADSEDHGWVKVLTRRGSDKILGVTIVAPHAGDLLAEYVLAIKHGLGLNKILGTIHIYPTLAEANKMAAGLWKKEHAPERLLRWVEKFHAWRRNKA
ncbi:pyruvate/2-oxoglutarate dehydrogenase complex dihydrolipoamide dehydrogenase (E3) component [Geothermobacter ehrlichii]|uniref:Pyruvate/2-oxoglutarate dehydrogenase complex dihydrolipoamide dehydrogenase (E3) component n=1 Tax=Geothermobacter ehrlichii TaxID=213224 RepID=A0A5D3WLK1_9BACT|nr:FAD-dependent oxidoreductase [Geothermobacter ehrlichii]TYO99014.1 pyruvate/2-oxoglutarate dehydrogenase complex dihydrolipoamide dehydrogenase (E3) component [Geothermobacter ehrlichii]